MTHAVQNTTVARRDDGRMAAVIFGVAIASCSSASLWLPTQDAASVVLVVQSGVDLRVMAFDARDAAAAAEITLGADDSEVYALLFDADLDDLGLIPGTQSFADRGLPLASADRILSARLAEDELAWRAQSGLPFERTIAVRPPCRELSAESVTLPGTKGDRPDFAIAIGPERLFVGTRAGRFFDVRRDGAIPLTQVSAETPHLAAFFDPGTDRAWLLGTQGRMVVGHPDRGFDVAPSMNTTNATRVWVDGRRGESPFELFAVTSNGTWEHFDGDRWTLLEATETSTPTRARWDIAYHAPGTAIAIGWSAEVMTVVREGVTEVVDLPVPEQPEPSPDALYSAGYVEGMGALVGTRYGRFFRDEGDRWNLIPVPPNNARAAVVAGFRGGVFAGGQTGVYWQFYDGFGYCPETVHGSEEPYAIVAMPPGLVLVDDAIGDTELSLTFLGFDD